jgi:hypothetical protein
MDLSSINSRSLCLFRSSAVRCVAALLGWAPWLGLVPGKKPTISISVAHQGNKALAVRFSIPAAPSQLVGHRHMGPGLCAFCSGHRKRRCSIFQGPNLDSDPETSCVTGGNQSYSAFYGT